MTDTRPNQMCPVCKCCSMRDGQCVGSCEPCGHHVPCPECEYQATRRQQLGQVIRQFADVLKDFETGALP